MPVGKSSLLRAGKAANQTQKAALPQANIVTVSVAEISSTPAGFVKDKRAENAALIQKYGVTEPLLLWADGETLRIIRGNATLSTCKKLEMTTVPAVIVRLSQEEAKSLARSLNTQPAAKAEKTVKAPAVAEEKPDPIHEEKFNAIKKIKRDLPYYLL
ncbi:MAG: hypothetical protein II368_03510 [Clostridia bacterium]|nr:hypothetical protein [Clostridia bacterium]